MTDARTTEQRDANDQLHTTIERVVRAYQTLPTSTVITSWIVLDSGLGTDGEGDHYQSFTLLPDDGSHINPEQILGAAPHSAPSVTTCTATPSPTENLQHPPPTPPDLRKQTATMIHFRSRSSL